jgi:hypothetical protein
VWQGLYTAGVVLPRPVSTCRYYHRSINWQKLYECGFSPLPPNSKPAYQVRKYALPESTSTRGLREMQEKDVDAVLSLLKRYLGRFDMAPEFTRDEAIHWFVPKIESGGEQVVWSYVVEVCILFSCLRVSTDQYKIGQGQEDHRFLLLLLCRVFRHWQRQARRCARGVSLLLRQ